MMIKHQLKKKNNYNVILFKIKSVNSLCVNNFNASFKIIYLYLFGFNAWYLCLFIFSIYALLFVEFITLCNKTPCLSYTFNEIDGLLFSKAV